MIPNPLTNASQLFLEALTQAGQQNEETQMDPVLMRFLEKIIIRSERILDNLPRNIASYTKTVITTAWKEPKFLDSNYQIAQTLIQLPVYNTIEKDLTKMIESYFPEEKVRLYKFGSRITGIGTDASDLDIYVDIGNTFEKCETRPSNLTHFKLSTVHNAMLESKNWRIIKLYKNAHIPIIRTIHLESNIKCDIGFSNSLSFCNSNVIKYLIAHQPVAQYMCIFLKKWMENNIFTYQISTHCITLMVIYFLQLQGLLPSIERLHSELPSKLFIGPWIANFPHKTLKDLGFPYMKVTTELLKMHLKLFFNYYATFDYENHVICPYFGLDNVLIEHFEKLFPQCYFDYVKENPAAALQLDSPMIVIDTIQLNDNAAQAVTHRGLRLFLECCRQTVLLIAELDS